MDEQAIETVPQDQPEATILNAPPQPEIPGLGLDDHSTEISPEYGMELLAQTCEDFEEAVQLEANMENLLISIEQASLEGLTPQSKMFATMHFNQLVRNYGEPTISAEQLDTVSLESEAKSFLSRTIEIVVRVWKSIVQIMKRFAANIKARLTSLNGAAKKISERLNFLQKKWIQGLKVTVEDPSGYLTYRGRAVDNLGAFKSFGEFAMQVSKATVEWVDDAKGKTHTLAAARMTKQSLMMGVSSEYYPLKALKKLPFHLMSGGGNSYVSDEFVGGINYELQSVDPETTELYACERLRYVVAGHPTFSGPHEMRLMDPRECDHLQGLIERIEEAHPRIDEFVQKSEDILKTYEEWHSQSAMSLSRSLGLGRDKPYAREVTSLLRAFGQSGMALAQLNQAIATDLYRSAHAHLVWAQKSAKAMEDKIQETEGSSTPLLTAAA